GATAVFTTTATGTSLQYQWYKNGVALSNGGRISGVNTNTLTITATIPGDAGTYKVVVSNNCASAEASANLTVEPLNPVLSVTKTAGSYVDANSNGYPDAGEAITYSYVVTNVGNVALTGITVVDDKLGAISLSAVTLAPGSQATGQKTHTLTQTEIESGTLTNVATADSVESPPATDTVTVTLSHHPLIAITKQSSHPALQVGKTIIYTYTVTNPGNVSLGSVTLTDDILGVISGPTSGDTNSNGRLDVTETWIYEKSYVVSFADRTTFTYPYQITNVATVTGTPTMGSAVSATTQATIRICTVELSINKTAPLSVSAGGLVTYTLLVTNDGPMDVATNVTVNDVLPAGLSNATYQIVGGGSGIWTGSLNLGDITNGTSVTVTITATVDPSTAGPLANTACVTSDSYDTNPADNCDSTTTTVTHNPALLVQKSGLPATAGVGDTIAYTITVTHHASSDGSPIHVTDVNDSLGVILAGPSGDDGDGWLESNETWIYTGSRIVLAQDPAELTNTVCVTGLDLDGDTVTDCDSTTTTVEHAPVLQVDKSGTPVAARVGDSVNYTITVRHALASDGSPVDITSVNDSLGIVLSGPSGDDGDGLLESSEVWTYTGSRSVLPADPKILVNEVCVGGEDLDGDSVEDCDSTTTTVDHDPVLLVQKSGVPSIANVGNTISYTVTVQHDPSSDNSPVAITAVNDSLGITLSGPTGDDGDALLEDGEIWTYIGSRAVLPSDPASLTNEVCVDGTDLDGDAVSDCGDTTTTVRHHPVLVVDKSGDPAAAAEGDTVDYTITVQHDVTSDGSPVDVASVNDSLAVSLSGPIGDDGDGLLENGEIWTYTGSRIIQASDPHLLTNTACVEGRDLDGDLVEDCDSTTTTISHPNINVVKDADVAFANIGETVTYSYSVNNTGDVDLYAVSLVDDILGSVSGPKSGDDGDAILETHETWIYEKTYVIVEGDLPGPLVNVATAAGTPLVGPIVVDTDSASVQITSQPGINVVKTASSGPFVVGNTITYTYDVTNTGNVTLSNITLSDDILGPISLAATTLAPGISTTGSATHVVTQADVDAG
ncbi:DUF11 domain-containing protein, partial [Candidatus Bipolaricaulota bacterium]|nr:DUF11 domain-containing protein [Candidatus Bipolaricaulota bacterium]